MVRTTCPRCRGAGQIIQHVCSACKGEGRTRIEKKITVKIPAGVDDGTRIRIAGEGEAAGQGMPGDLYVFLRVEPHDIFERDGENLHMELPISMVQAALGAKLDVPALDDEHTVKIPAGSQPSDVVRVTGAGVQRLKGRGRGDLFVHIRVVVPNKLSRRQKDLLKQFAAAD